MGAGTVVLNALKKAGSWLISNSEVAVGAVDKVSKFQAERKALNNDERFQVIEDNIEDLFAATLQLDDKTETELTTIKARIQELDENITKELNAVKEQIAERDEQNKTEILLLKKQIVGIKKTLLLLDILLGLSLISILLIVLL